MADNQVTNCFSCGTILLRKAREGVTELAILLQEIPSVPVSFWASRVQNMVKPQRFAHIERVAALAKDIALAHSLDAERAYLAGILHDVARDLPSDELLRLAPPETEADADNPLAVHGRAGRAILEQWGITDTVVLDAVEEHVTGPRDGNLLSICVYVADVSEPGRGVNDNIRELAFLDLERAYHEALTCKVHYLQSKGRMVHPRTLEAYQRLLEIPTFETMIHHAA
jgi:predicted HD superfamily hydrolase involved in NAD metabolism